MSKPREIAKLFSFAAEGSVDGVRCAIEADPTLVHTRDEKGRTLLMAVVSSEARSPTIVAFLLQAGADADARDHQGMNALHWAVDINGPGLDAAVIFPLLIRAGARLEARGQHGWTPLMNAVISGTSREVEVLVAAGANVEVRFPDDTLPAFARGMTLVEAAGKDAAKQAALRRPRGDDGPASRRRAKDG